MKNLIYGASNSAKSANGRWLKILIFAIILGFYASFLFTKINLPESDNDAGLYISDGRVIWETKKVFRHNIYSYTVPEYPVYDHHWLSSVTFYFVSEYAGFKGLSVFKNSVLLLAFILLFCATLKKADFWLAAVFSFPTILILAARTRIRPEMFSYLFIALYLYLLFDLEKHSERKRIFLLIPLQLLWVNFHLFFFVGIALVGGFLFEKIVLRFPVAFWRVNMRSVLGDPMIKKLLLILPLMIAVCFINPNGIEGAIAPFKTHSYESFTVGENQPLFNFKANFFSWDFLGSAFAPMVLIFLVSLIFGFRQRPIFFFLAGIGSAAAALIHVRLLTLFAMMFLPAASSNFNGAFLKAKDWLGRKAPAVAMALGYALILGIAIIFPYKAYTLIAYGTERGYKTDWGIGLSRHSNSAAEFFKEQALKGPIFNDYDIGGYIIYHLFPRETVFVDNNGADSYPVSFFDDIFGPVFSWEEAWRAIQEKYGIKTIFISLRDGSPMVGGFLWRRMHDPSWALVYADTYNVILIKNVPEYGEVIRKFHITPENAREKLVHMLESNDIVDRIIAGRLLYLIGREDLATSVHKKVVAEYPKNSWVWLYMGSVKVSKDNPADLISALIFIENAVNMGEKTSESYTWLGLAYLKTAQFEKAKDAFQKALRIDPGRYDTTNYLKQLQVYVGSQKK